MNRAEKIAGPMLMSRQPATANEVTAALIGAQTPFVVVQEYANIARRRHGLPSTSAMAGDAYRKRRQALADERKGLKPVVTPPKTPKWPQRLARRISRLFRKH